MKIRAAKPARLFIHTKEGCASCFFLFFPAFLRHIPQRISPILWGQAKNRKRIVNLSKICYNSRSERGYYRILNCPCRNYLHVIKKGGKV